MGINNTGIAYARAARNFRNAAGYAYAAPTTRARGTPEEFIVTREIMRRRGGVSGFEQGGLTSNGVFRFVGGVLSSTTIVEDRVSMERTCFSENWSDTREVDGLTLQVGIVLRSSLAAKLMKQFIDRHSTERYSASECSPTALIRD